MSLHEYVMSQEIAKQDYPFYALIMAALRQADDINMMKLTEVFPEVTIELRKRYNAPGGALDHREAADLVRWRNNATSK